MFFSKKKSHSTLKVERKLIRTDVNEGSSTGGSRMSSSFNQSSSYNRTFERKVLEESTPTVTTRMFTSSPLNTIKSTLGSGFPSDLGLGTGSFVQPHNYQFGTATSGSFQSSDDSLSATMDCAAFAPEDLKDSLGSIERHFVRKFAMPRNATADSVNSNLTSDGMLTVTASAPKAKDNSPIRTIPVKIVAGGQQQQNGGGQFQQNGQ
uniref:SHSP domain-containing protein n=1 Tax=Globodera pallida TaxID=36090 RepID=A0A183BV21_GLOPA